MINLQRLDPCPGCGVRMYAHAGEFVERQNYHHQCAIAGTETDSPTLVQINVKGDSVRGNQNIMKIGNITSTCGGMVIMVGRSSNVISPKRPSAMSTSPPLARRSDLPWSPGSKGWDLGRADPQEPRPVNIWRRKLFDNARS